MSALPHSTQSLPVRFQGSRFARWLLRCFGWQVKFEGFPSLTGVIIAYPHTSNWDYPIGLLAKWTMGLPAHYLIKDSALKIPVIGKLIAYWGGVPVNRSQVNGLTEQVTQAMREARASNTPYWLAIAPEGTRKHAPFLRSGFYHLTLAAGVPLGLAHFNYAKREVGMIKFVTLTGNQAADLAEIAAFYAEHASARYPTQAAPICFRPPAE